jgi:hypothetical protein
MPYLANPILYCHAQSFTARSILYLLITFYTALPKPLMPDLGQSSLVFTFPSLFWVIQSQSHVCLLSFCPSCSYFNRLMLAQYILAPHHLPAKPIPNRLIKFYITLPILYSLIKFLYWPIQSGIGFSSLILGNSVSVQVYAGSVYSCSSPFTDYILII